MYTLIVHYRLRRAYYFERRAITLLVLLYLLRIYCKLLKKLIYLQFYENDIVLLWLLLIFTVFIMKFLY